MVQHSPAHLLTIPFVVQCSLANLLNIPLVVQHSPLPLATQLTCISIDYSYGFVAPPSAHLLTIPLVTHLTRLSFDYSDGFVAPPCPSIDYSSSHTAHLSIY